MIIYIVLTLLIVALVNLASSRHYTILDLTPDKIFTLSEQSMKIIKNLKQEVSLYAFVRPDGIQEVKDILNQYEYNSDKLTYNISDPGKDPLTAEKFNVTDYGTVVVEAADGRKESTTELNEESITNAIYKAVSTRQKTIHVLTGHDGRDMESLEPLGWSSAKQALMSSMYDVKELNWFETGAIPDDTDLLIIPGPRDDLQPAEIDRLSEYLSAGKNLMLTLDPTSVPNINNLFGEYGITFNLDLILDPVSQKLGMEPLVAAVASYHEHPVTEGLKAATFFPVSRSIELNAANNKGAKLMPIASTGESSWGEKDPDSIKNGTPEYSEKDDLPGPRLVVASATIDVGPPKEERKIGAPTKLIRMIITGDSDFASNAWLNLSGNKDLLLNMVSWLLEEESRISIRPKTRGFNPIIFTRSQLLVVFWVVVVAVPLAVIAAGALVAFNRRRS